MNESRPCPECKAEMPAQSPAGLCPRCLLKAGLASQKASEAQNQPTVTSPRAGFSQFVPPTPEELAGKFGQLEILELLGKGGMGAVYKARQPSLDRFVAVKILPAEAGHDSAFAERFTREARALARLSHPHLVAVYEFGEADGLFYFVMEYVDGVNLRQAMKAGAIEPRQALDLVGQICDALQFAHDEGVIHRDIKPENILIDKRGRIKIADFGLAKLLGQETAEEALTGTNQAMGTWRYMAPEQMDDSRAVDHRADIYSLGVVFYELLTGELPIGRFAPPSKKVQIDVRLDEIVLRALESEPSLRYQHASEVKTNVEKIASTSDKQVESPIATFTNSGTRVPKAYYLETVLFAFLAWLPFLLLWNFREIGLVISCGVLGAFVVWRGRQAAKFFPATVARWQQRTKWARRRTIAFNFVTALLGGYFFFLSTYQAWERWHWNFMAKTSSEWTQEYQGVEHRLLIQLKEFENEPPRADLLQTNFYWEGGWRFGTTSPPYLGFFMAFTFIAVFGLAIWCIFGTYHGLLSDKAGLGIGWKPYGWTSVGLTFTTVVPVGIFAIALFIGDVASGQINGGSGIATKVSVPLPDVMKRLESWQAANGYETGDHSTWNVTSIPRHETLAVVEVRHLWQPDVFDRWRMTYHGFERKLPDLAVEIVGSVRNKEASIHIYARNRASGFEEANQMFADLIEALKKE